MKSIFRKYMFIQRKRINIDKWKEGERINKDPGNEYIFRWIKENARIFKVLWEQSVCKACVNYKDCGYMLFEKCDKYGKMVE